MRELRDEPVYTGERYAEGGVISRVRVGRAKEYAREGEGKGASTARGGRRDRPSTKRPSAHPTKGAQAGKKASAGIVPACCSAWNCASAWCGSQLFCARHRCANAYVRRVTCCSCRTRDCCSSVCSSRQGQSRVEEGGKRRDARCLPPVLAAPAVPLLLLPLRPPGLLQLALPLHPSAVGAPSAWRRRGRSSRAGRTCRKG